MADDPFTLADLRALVDAAADEAEPVMHRFMARLGAASASAKAAGLDRERAFSVICTAIDRVYGESGPRFAVGLRTARETCS